MLSTESACLTAIGSFGSELASRCWVAGLKRRVSAQQSWEQAYIDRCVAFDGVATAALHVEVRLAEGYLQRVDTISSMTFNSRSDIGEETVRSLFVNPRWGACVPMVCLAFGEGSLLRAVLSRIWFELLHNAWQMPPLNEQEILVERWLRWAPQPPFLGPPAVGFDSGLCICDRVWPWHVPERHEHDLQLPHIAFLTHENVLAVLNSPLTPQRARMLLEMFRGAEFGGDEHEYNTLADRLEQREVVARALEPASSEGHCVAGLLNAALLRALATRKLRDVSPLAFMREMDLVAQLTLVLADCPTGELPNYAGVGGIAPIFLFSPAGVARQLKQAAEGLRRGQKVLGPAEDWSRGAEDCDVGPADAVFLQGAAGASMRIMCLYVADAQQPGEMELVGSTVAAHCDSAVFFVAPPDAEDRHIWRMARAHGGHRVVNLRQSFGHPLLGVDGADSADAFSPPASKVLMILLAASLTLLHEADIFCQMTLGSLLFPENLRAFAQAVGLQIDQLHWFGALNFSSLRTRGGDLTGSVCLTRGGLEQLGFLLRKVPPLRSKDPSQYIDRCAFQTSRQSSIILQRCLEAANISRHPALEDALGRSFVSTARAPCTEPQLWRPPQQGRRQYAAAVLGHEGWRTELHRFLPCQSEELLRLGPQHWLSPYAFLFEGFQAELSAMARTYEAVRSSEGCVGAQGHQFRLVHDTRKEQTAALLGSSLAMVHVVYTGDAAVLPGTLSSMLSLARRLFLPELCTIHVIVPPEDLRLGEQLAECFRMELLEELSTAPFVRIHAMRIPRLSFKNFHAVNSRILNRPDFAKPIAFARLYLHEYLPEVSRVIYLDSDTIVKTDLGPLYRMVMRHPLAAVQGGCDPQHWPDLPPEAQRHLDPDLCHSYFSTGVMVVDLSRWRSGELTRAVEDWAEKVHGYNVEQTALNLAVRADYDRLHFRWNWQCLGSLRTNDTRLGFGDATAMDSAHILHWNCGVTQAKPWHAAGERHWMHDYLYELPRLKCQGL